MKKSLPSGIVRFVFLFVALFAADKTFAQLADIVNSNITGSYVERPLFDRGGARASAAIQSTTTGTKQVLFADGAGDYTPKWVGSTTDKARAINSKLAGKAFVYYSGGWDSDMDFTATNGNYYTFIIGNVDNSNNDMSILETTYDPKTISTVSQSPVASSVYTIHTVTVNVTLSAAPSSGERVYVRWHTGAGYGSATLSEITNFGGTANGSFTIPTQTAGTTVSYYVLTSNQAVTSNADVDYLTLKINNNSNANYSYTVLAQPVAPSFVVHQQSTATVVNGCGGSSTYWNANPTINSNLVLQWNIENGSEYTGSNIYYTTDGSTPAGNRGTPSGTSASVSSSFVCNTGPKNIVTGTIPASANLEGKTIKYIIGAWNGVAGIEGFATNFFSLRNTSPLVYSYALPGITLSAAPLSAFTSCAGSVSAEQSFTATCVNLTNNLVVSAPTGFEVSKTSGSGFGATVNFTPAEAATAIIYVRMSTSAIGTPSGNVSCTSAGTGLTKNKAVSGTVNALPTVTASNVSGCPNTNIALIGSPLGGTFSITNPYNGTSDTTYTYSYTDGNGCSNTSSSATVTLTTEINFNNIDDDCNGSLYNGHAPVVVDVTTPSGALATMGTTISCSTATNTTPYSGASVTYKFKVTKTTAPTSVAFVSSNTTSFVFSSASNAAHSSSYDVQATAIVNGEEQPYNGNTTSYTTPAAPTLPNPPTQAGPPNVTCAYTLARIDSYIYANNTTTYGANRYEFLVERMDNGNPVQTISIATTVPYFKLTNIVGIPATMQVTYGTTYRIKVRYGYGATSFGSQIYTAYGSECLVSTPALPVASIACGTTLASINAYVYASGFAAGASQFEFKVTRVSPQQPGELPIGATTEEILPRNVANFKLTMLTSLFVGLQKEYSVAVRYTITAYGSSNVSSWGTIPCSLFTPDFPETTIVESQCGVEGVPSSVNQYVYATGIAGATQYRFRLYNAVDAPYTAEAPYDQFIDSPNNYIKLNQFPSLIANVAYSVTVVAQLYGEYANIDLAKDCSITAPEATPAPSGPAKAVIASVFQASAYPNPFANNFMIAVKTGSQSVVSLKVYDMIGRLIEQRESTVSDLETATIGDRYPSGVYNVVVSQQDAVQTLRVVKR